MLKMKSMSSMNLLVWSVVFLILSMCLEAWVTKYCTVVPCDVDNDAAGKAVMSFMTISGVLAVLSGVVKFSGVFRKK